MVDLHSLESFGASASQPSRTVHPSQNCCESEKAIPGNRVLEGGSALQSSSFQIYPTHQATNKKEASQICPTSTMMSQMSSAADPYTSLYSESPAYMLHATGPRAPRQPVQTHFYPGFFPADQASFNGPIRRPRTGKRRKGVQQLITAFDVLRSRLYVYPPERHLSKIETLRMAISYIKDLERLLKQADDSNPTPGPDSESSTSKSDKEVEVSSNASPKNNASPGPQTDSLTRNTVTGGKGSQETSEKSQTDYDLLTAGSKVFPEMKSTPDLRSVNLSPGFQSDCSELRRVLSQSSIFSIASCPESAQQLGRNHLTARETLSKSNGLSHHLFSSLNGIDSPLSPASQAAPRSPRTFHQPCRDLVKSASTDLHCEERREALAMASHAHSSYITGQCAADGLLFSRQNSQRGTVELTPLYEPQLFVPSSHIATSMNNTTIMATSSLLCSADESPLMLPNPLSPDQSLDGEDVDMFDMIEKMLSDSDSESFDPWISL